MRRVESTTPVYIKLISPAFLPLDRIFDHPAISCALLATSFCLAVLLVQLFLPGTPSALQQAAEAPAAIRFWFLGSCSVPWLLRILTSAVPKTTPR